MRFLHINNSYSTWRSGRMDEAMKTECRKKYATEDYKATLNRKFSSLFIEWILHNIGYYITKPFSRFANITARCKDVDLEEWQ